MKRRDLARVAAVVGGIAILTAVIVALPPGVPAADTPASKGEPGTFGPTKVWAIHLEMSTKQYEAMQPPPGGFGPPGGPLPKKTVAQEMRDSERNLFGTEFPWVQGDLTVDGKSIKRVGIRYAGEITYFASARGLKRPLKIDVARFAKQDLSRLAAIHLHAMPLDPAKAREALGFAAFRDAGVPAPRTAFAEVTLSVPGRFDRELLGLYTVVEDVDRRFLADRFGTDKGLLLRPARMRGLDFLGDDWEQYKGLYQPQGEPTSDETKRLVEFARLVNQAGDEEFKKHIDTYLDVDEFLRFMAANALTTNLESFLALGHNYSLYLNPKTNKFVFIPGDLEFSFANFLLMGTADQLMDLSLTHPYPGESKLPDRLLAIKEVNDKYLKLLRELTASVFTKDRLLKDAEAIEKATKAVRDREAKAASASREPPPGFGPPGAMAPQPPDLKKIGRASCRERGKDSEHEHRRKQHKTEA